MIDQFMQQLRENDRILEENRAASQGPVGGTIPNATAPAPEIQDAVIDFNEPRTGLIIQNGKAGLACPNCKTPVIAQNPVYLAGLIDKKGMVIDQLYLNAPIGLFCPNCPVSLLNLEQAKTLLKSNAPAIEEKLAKGCKLTILGVVVETGAENNQTKIVPFNAAAPATQKKPAKSKSKSKQKVKKKKRLKK